MKGFLMVQQFFPHKIGKKFGDIPAILRHEYIYSLETAHTRPEVFTDFIADRVIASKRCWLLSVHSLIILTISWPHTANFLAPLLLALSKHSRAVSTSVV